MSSIATVGTYLPPWGKESVRSVGPDEDAVTLAVAAGRAALEGNTGAVRSVVVISRDLPLLEGGNSAPLAAGLGLNNDVQIVEQIGGAPAVLDAVAGAAAGTLVIGADLAPAGAAAVLITDGGVDVSLLDRVVRSLPVISRGADGVRRNYEDPRLDSVAGGAAAVAELELDSKPVAVAGVSAKVAAGYAGAKPPVLPTTGASSALFALAALQQLGEGGVVLAVEQASATAVNVAGVPAVHRDEPAAQPVPRLTYTPGPDIAISLAAYERAFESKVRWEAGKCDACGTLALPPRLRCLECGSEAGWSHEPLPRTAEVYTTVTIHIPVPGLPTPYSLAVVEMDEVGVRSLVKVTDVEAGTAQIGDRGNLVLRRVAVRSGVPDYGYAFQPTTRSEGASS